jgi:hypothetical protein
MKTLVAVTIIVAVIVTAAIVLAQGRGGMTQTQQPDISAPRNEPRSGEETRGEVPAGSKLGSHPVLELYVTTIFGDSEVIETAATGGLIGVTGEQPGAQAKLRPQSGLGWSSLPGDGTSTDGAIFFRVCAPGMYKWSLGGVKGKIDVKGENLCGQEMNYQSDPREKTTYQ